MGELKMDEERVTDSCWLLVDGCWGEGAMGDNT